MSEEAYLFDASLYYPALVLIRIPRETYEKAPAQDVEFGTGFFAGCEGLVLTARHNLVDLITNKPLEWMWVCCYERNTTDWIDCPKVKVDRNLLDKETDAALLKVDGETPKVLPLSLDWRPGG